MSLSKIAFMAGAVLGLNLQAAPAQDVQQQVGMNGSVNFTQRLITATGTGMPGGTGGRAGVLRAAKMDALRNLLEVIHGIALTSQTKVENQMLSNDVVKTRVEGIAWQFPPSWS